jgi:hypothetical protein
LRNSGVKVRRYQSKEPVLADTSYLSKERLREREVRAHMDRQNWFAVTGSKINESED